VEHKRSLSIIMCRAFAVIVVHFGRTVSRFSGFEKGLIGRDKDFK
jgi:hypothetical protein